MSHHEKENGSGGRRRSNQCDKQGCATKSKEESHNARKAEEAALVGMGSQFDFDLENSEDRNAADMVSLVDVRQPNKCAIVVKSVDSLEQSGQAHKKAMMDRWLSSRVDLVQYNRSFGGRKHELGDLAEEAADQKPDVR
ncbi:hypothetical protein PRZ48_005921 [Zasmidium cellare]|uniref:Uncharacterized protein n=1 Tax=Zasmidium cellare TaxID=395010 RepID=A0ABR0EMJ0_ZASCE|nr:hypothetical protein PRZ48_005921 [Zasmidium cellare]